MKKETSEYINLTFHSLMLCLEITSLLFFSFLVNRIGTSFQRFVISFYMVSIILYRVMQFGGNKK